MASWHSCSAALRRWRYSTGAAPKFQSVDITGVEWGKDFKLTDHTGRVRELADFRGKAVAMFFGFTHCPDMCPTTMAKLGEAIKLLADDDLRVQASS